jgi:hypothetical protein
VVWAGDAIDTAATAARHIVRAVARRRRESIITGHGKLAVWLQRHLPWLVRAGVGRFGVRGRREPSATSKARTS